MPLAGSPEKLRRHSENIFDVYLCPLAPGGYDGGGCIYNLLGGLLDFGVDSLVGVTQPERGGRFHDPDGVRPS
jgi:hypothetical protein